MNRAFKLLSAAALLAALAIPALADIPPPKPQPKPEPKPVEEAVLPWTVEEVREQWGKGKSFLLDIETEDGGSGWVRYEAEDITEKGFKRSSITCEKGKAEKREAVGATTWDDYFGELKKMLGSAEKTQAEITVPFNTLACTLYTIKQENGWMKVWLHSSVPGWVVQFERETKRGEKRDYEKMSLRSIDEPMTAAPWTADKMAENLKGGASIKYKMTTAKGNGTFELNITAADIDGVTYTQSEKMDSDEKKGNESKAQTDTWDKYVRHFMTPRAGATISEETVKTLLGDTVCVVYTCVSEATGIKLTQKSFVAKNEPGLLVRYSQQTEASDSMMNVELELTEFKKGK